MIYYEPDKFGEDDTITINEYQDLDYPHLHFHHNYEMVFMLDGELKISLDGKEFTLEKNQILLVFPNQIHAFYSLSGSAHARVCIFSPNYINEFYQNTLNKCPERLVLDFGVQITQFLKDNLHPQSGRYMQKACLYSVCAEISRQTTFTEKHESKDFVLVHQLVSYISKNYQNDITLSTTAQHLGYNYQYLSNLLHKYKINFYLLLNEHRLDFAKHLLKNSELSITHIAFECGYNNVRTFNRNFLKRFHLTPREFRLGAGI